jgi:hypothetical protein
VLNKTDLNEAMDCLENALAAYPNRIAVKQELVVG